MRQWRTWLHDERANMWAEWAALLPVFFIVGTAMWALLTTELQQVSLDHLTQTAFNAIQVYGCYTPQVNTLATQFVTTDHLQSSQIGMAITEYDTNGDPEVGSSGTNPGLMTPYQDFTVSVSQQYRVNVLGSPGPWVVTLSDALTGSYDALANSQFSSSTCIPDTELFHGSPPALGGSLQ